MNPLLGALILLFMGISTACLVYLHFLPTGYNPLRNAVSEYGVGKYHFWYQAMCVGQAIAAFLLAAALATSVTPAPFITDAALVLFGLARLVISQAPVYGTNRRRVSTTGIHMIMALLIFGSAVVASVSFSRYIADNNEWMKTAATLRVFRWGIVVFAIATGAAVVAPGWEKYIGTVERLLYISIIGWFVTMAIHLL